MDRREQHRHHKEKVREQKKMEEQAYEEEQEKRRMPVRPAWLAVAGVALTALVVYVWTFGLR